MTTTTRNSVNKELFEELLKEVLPEIETVGGKFIFGIVNTSQNGRRVSFSKALVEQLEVSDIVYAMPSIAKRKLVLGKELPYDRAVKLELKGDGKKLCYNSKFVKLLTDVFSLDFSKQTSLSVNNIDFDKIDGINTPVAVVSF